MQPGSATAGRDTISGRFVAQTCRPDELWDVDIFALWPYQRALLIADGTVTRLVEAMVWEPLSAEVLDQRGVEVDDERATFLDLSAAASVVRRRVAITGRESGQTPAFAESLLVVSRLPDAFFGSLNNPEGLGEVIGRLGLETRRELLWFGYTAAPGWAKTAVTELPLLTRSYRIITGGTPAILITESFPTTAPPPTPPNNLPTRQPEK